MVDKVAKELCVNGRFDVVVCDYVLNSIDSSQAENDVLNCLQAFCKEDGTLFFSGRLHRSTWATQAEFVVNRQSRRCVEFLDKNNLTAIYREGHWFYQKFHSIQDIKRICDSRGLSINKIEKNGNSWNVSAKNNRIDRGSALESIEREFNLPMSDKGNRLNRHTDVLEIMQCLLAS
jgi:ParB family chromosome partitioning protein